VNEGGEGQYVTSLVGFSQGVHCPATKKCLLRTKGLSHLGFITAVTSLNGSQPNFTQCLAVTWAGRLYIHFGGCCSVTECCQVQNSLCVLQVLRSPVRSITARQSSSGREPCVRSGCENCVCVFIDY